MNAPDNGSWRRPSRLELTLWSRGAAHPLVRVIDEEGRTEAEGLLVAYDAQEGRAALLGPLHRPDTRTRVVSASPGQLWVRA